jgi:hypothetical protein
MTLGSMEPRPWSEKRRPVVANRSRSRYWASYTSEREATAGANDVALREEPRDVAEAPAAELSDAALTAEWRDVADAPGAEPSDVAEA